MARKVADSLQVLARHAALSPEFRAMLGQLQQRWVQQDAAQDEPVRLPPQALWHKTPEVLQ